MTRDPVTAAQRAYRAALRRETAAVCRLPNVGASRAQLDACWRLADATNAAYRALEAARRAAERGP